MNLKVFCTYDSKAFAYSTPFFLPTAPMAVRAFSDLVSDMNTSVGRHPEDFTLFEIGSYDDLKGCLVPLSPHINHGLASSYKKSVVSNNIVVTPREVLK